MLICGMLLVRCYNKAGNVLISWQEICDATQKKKFWVQSVGIEIVIEVFGQYRHICVSDISKKAIPDIRRCVACSRFNQAIALSEAGAQIAVNSKGAQEFPATPPTQSFIGSQMDCQDTRWTWGCGIHRPACLGLPLAEEQRLSDPYAAQCFATRPSCH